MILTYALAAAVAAPADLSWSASYLGESITHPGAVAGLERPLWRADGHALFTGAQAGGYTHPGNHTGVFLGGELGYRWTAQSGWSTEAALGAGVMHVRLAGDVYAAGPGGVSPTVDWGRLALMPTAALGLGYDMAGIGWADHRAFVRLVGFGEYPVNTYMLPHLALQLGLSWGGQP